MDRKYRWIAMASAVAFAGTVFAVAIPPNFPAALEAQKKLAERRPADASVANDLGNLLHMAGDPDQAEEAYRRAAELSPEDPVPHYNLGLLLQEQRKPKAALKEFTWAAKYDPANAWAHFQIGAINEELGNRTEAIRAYATAFSLDPSLAQPRVNPQIIESRFVYEAMVRGYKNNDARPLAPKVYDDPNRIARLLVAAAAAEDAMAEEELHEASERLAEEGSGRGLQRVEDQGTPDQMGLDDTSDDSSASSPRQILTPDTIERGGSLGQVNSPGQSRAARPANRPTTSSGSRSTGRTPTSTRGFRPPGSSDTSRTRPGRVRFEPSIQSTGSLGLELAPSHEAVPRAS